jgi:hypothetical protein
MHGLCQSSLPFFGNLPDAFIQKGCTHLLSIAVRKYPVIHRRFLVGGSRHPERTCWLKRDTLYRAITVIFFEYTGGLCGICISSPISNCRVCLPGGNWIIVSVSPAPKCR